MGKYKQQWLPILFIVLKWLTSLNLECTVYWSIRKLVLWPRLFEARIKFQEQQRNFLCPVLWALPLRLDSTPSEWEPVFRCLVWRSRGESGPAWVYRHSARRRRLCTCRSPPLRNPSVCSTWKKKMNESLLRFKTITKK